MAEPSAGSNRKAALLAEPVAHIDITSFDARPLVAAWRGMSFSARAAARAADIFDTMLADPDCAVILTLAGSSSAAGCMHVYRDLVANGMVDAVVATGAAIVDMDFFEALGFCHYKGSPEADDGELRALAIDRIFDTYIDEDALRACDFTLKAIADGLAPGAYSSRAFLREMGRWLKANAQRPGSLVETAFDCDVPIFCPALSDSSAGFGLVKHQAERRAAGAGSVAIDSVADFRELTEVKIAAGSTGLFMIGGGVPKNFAQDTVVCADILGHEAEMHKYAVQITVADTRDGACSSSTLKEANSWGKVDEAEEQMVFAEATTVLPIIAADAYHRGRWRSRKPRRFARLFED